VREREKKKTLRILFNNIITCTAFGRGGDDKWYLVRADGQHPPELLLRGYCDVGVTVDLAPFAAIHKMTQNTYGFKTKRQKKTLFCVIGRDILGGGIALFTAAKANQHLPALSLHKMLQYKRISLKICFRITAQHI
jgi:hypothetical protein